MRTSMQFTLVAVPALLAGVVAGAIGTVWVMLERFETPLDAAAARVVEAAGILGEPSLDGAQPRTDAEAAQHLADDTNRMLVLAAAGYSSLQPRHREALVSAVRRLDGDPRILAGAARNGAWPSADVRRCILAGGGDTTVESCATAAIARVQAADCGDAASCGNDERKLPAIAGVTP